VSVTKGTAADSPDCNEQGTIGALPDGTASLDSFRTDSGISFPGEGRLEMAVEIHFPKHLVEPAVTLVCLPGGGTNRRFFDLRPAESQDDASFSFARQMTARGFIVASVDHLGIGESSRPKDGYALSGDVLSQAADHVHGTIGARVQAHYGSTFAHPCTIGVGHSMGAMVTVLQQAQHHTHQAIALLGFSTLGLPKYVPQPLHALASDPVALRTQLPILARQMFKEPYPRLEQSAESRAMFAGDRADARGIAALKVAGKEPLLPVPGFHSMLPGNVAREAASIDVPVYLALGDRDIVGPPSETPGAFQRSSGVVLHVMPETGHSHFLFASRFALFDGIAVWARSVTRNCAWMAGLMVQQRRL
jgi:pimeloyl-ACP methyl ester carboxylesterase